MSSHVGAHPLPGELFDDEEFDDTAADAHRGAQEADLDSSGLLPFDDEFGDTGVDERVDGEVGPNSTDPDFSRGSFAREADDNASRPSTVIVSNIQSVANSKSEAPRQSSMKKKRLRQQGGPQSSSMKSSGGRASASAASQKPKKKRREYIDEGEAITRVQDFLSRMSESATLDEESMRNNEPATNKLRMIDEVVSEVQKPKWVQWYLQEGLCHILDRWLSPLPNGSLPNITLRRKLLDLIRKLPISIDYLTDTALGVKLVTFWKSREESDENRVVIKEVITALVHPLLSYSRQATAPSSTKPSLQSRSAATSPAPQQASSVLSRISGGGSNLRASIPRTAPRSFSVAPKSFNIPPQGSIRRDSEIPAVGFKLQRHENNKNLKRKRC